MGSQNNQPQNRLQFDPITLNASKSNNPTSCERNTLSFFLSFFSFKLVYFLKKDSPTNRLAFDF